MSGVLISRTSTRWDSCQPGCGTDGDLPEMPQRTFCAFCAFCGKPSARRVGCLPQKAQKAQKVRWSGVGWVLERVGSEGTWMERGCTKGRQHTVRQKPGCRRPPRRLVWGLGGSGNWQLVTGNPHLATRPSNAYPARMPSASAIASSGPCRGWRRRACGSPRLPRGPG